MIAAFDIGGSAIKSAWAESAEAIHPIGRVETPREDFGAFTGALRSAIAAMPGRPRAVAISITGVTDPATGKLICANIPAVHGRALGHELTELLGVPVIVANDADCFVLTEARLGAGQGHEIVFGIILGTGVGGGLAVRGQLANGDGGYAGEWGHGSIVAAQAGEPPLSILHFACGCGRMGCVDTIGGARGLERLDSFIHGGSRDSKKIIAAWETGEASAVRTLEIYIALVSAPLALAVNITGASIVPVGGGLANSGRLVAALDAAVREKILRALDRPLLVAAQGRMEPGLTGAALLGLERADDNAAA